MLQIENKTPFSPSLALFPDKDGIDTVYPILKATFTYDSGLSLAKEQLPIVMVDEYWEDAATSSIKNAAEATPAKDATDLFVVGNAYSPGGRQVEELLCSVTVGRQSKSVRVFGDRIWSDGFFRQKFTPPVPFSKMPLTYERAYGGTDISKEGEPIPYAFNPVGRGYRHKRGTRPVANLPAPNLEDPSSPIALPSDTPRPASFGAISGHWEPRIKYAGTYDEAWQKNRAPYLPTDFNTRFLNCATQELIFAPYLQGGEPFELVNLSAEGPQRGNIPKLAINLVSTVEGKQFPLPMHIDSVTFRTDEHQLVLVWKSRQQLDKKTLKLEKLTFAIEKIESRIEGL